MNDLSQQHCVSIQGGEPVLSDAEIKQFQGQAPGWTVQETSGEKQLEKAFKFPDFSKALAFTDHIGQLAEQENHHPALLTEWGKVTVTWWTHKIKGLHRNDLIMAAKTDQAYTMKRE